MKNIEETDSERSTCTSDKPFTAKARKLQSKWREEQGLEMGYGPGPSSTVKYGNMIVGGKESGKNFYFPQTFAYANWRVNKKLKDETIEEYRLMNNLMSSQPMAFNFFHPLMMMKAENPAAVDLIMQAIFPELPIFKVKEIGLEFIPTPIERYGNDKSAMDAYVLFWDAVGAEYLIAIEVKYTDSLGTNAARDYKNQISILKDMGYFSSEGIADLESEKIKVSQIYRNFILAEKYAAINKLKDVYSVIFAPNGHPTTGAEINSIRELLTIPFRYKISDYKWEDVVKAVLANCPENYLSWIAWFEKRYLDFDNELVGNT